jgi:hypothetical protein
MTATFQMGDIVTSSRGAKSIPILTLDNQPFIWMPSEMQHVCYEPSAYNDEAANRVNVCFAVTDMLETQLTKYDDVIRKALTKDSLKYFGQVLTETQIKERVQPSIKTSEKGFSNFRVKMNKSGRGRCQVYDMNREPRGLPESFLNSCIKPRLQLKGLWMMGRDMGPLWELVAIQVDEKDSNVCPF